MCSFFFPFFFSNKSAYYCAPFDRHLIVLLVEIVTMVVKEFYLLGESSSTARKVELEDKLDFEGLQHWIAGQFAIVEPNGTSALFFHGEALHRNTLNPLVVEKLSILIRECAETCRSKNKNKNNKKKHKSRVL